jgi:hypothetical protein
VPAKTQVLTALGNPPPDDKVREKARSLPVPHIVDTKPKARMPVAAVRGETAGKPEQSKAEIGATLSKEIPVHSVSANGPGDEVTDDLITPDIQFEDQPGAASEPLVQDASQDATIDIEEDFADKTAVAVAKERLAKGWKFVLVIGAGIGVAIGAYLPKVKALSAKSWQWMTDRGQAFAAWALRAKGVLAKSKEQQAISGMVLSAKGSRFKDLVSASRKRGVAVLSAVAALVPKITPWISNNRKVVALVGGLVALLLLILVVVALTADSDESSPGIQQASVLPETGSQAKSQPAPPTVEEPTQPTAQLKSDTVSVEIQGMPSGARVMVAGAEVSLPLSLPLSADSVDISVTAKGYRPFADSVVPDRDQKIDVVMEKDEPIEKSASMENRPSEKKRVKKRRTGKRKRWARRARAVKSTSKKPRVNRGKKWKRRARRARAVKSTSKPQVNRGKLASNPFGD